MPDRSLRVLYVIDSLAPGGAETSLVAMAPQLVDRNVDLHVLPLGPALDLAPALREVGVTVHERGEWSGRLNNVRAVIRTARRLQPNLVHTTLFEADLAGRTAARILAIPSSTSLVNEYYGQSHARESHRLKLHAARELDRITARWASRFHAVSVAVADLVGPVLGISRDLIDVIPRGRDAHRFPFRPTDTRQATRKVLGIDDDTPLILGVGRQEPQKGLLHLLRAAPVIASSLPNAVILVAGREGRATQELRAFAKHLPLQVRFLGHRTDVPALLAAADVLAFPSEREGSPGTLIEAMAVGTPIVAFEIAPCLEVLGGTEQLTGLVTPVGDPVKLGDAVVATLEKPEDTHQRVASARVRFESDYAIDSVAARMVDFFSRSTQPIQYTNRGAASGKYARGNQT